MFDKFKRRVTYVKDEMVQKTTKILNINTNSKHLFIRLTANCAIFTRGDLITGEVVLNLSKPEKVGNICLKLIGKVSTSWSVKDHEDRTQMYSAKGVFLERIVEIWKPKHKDEALPAGNQVFPFSILLEPRENEPFPPSWEGSNGVISYDLCAYACRKFPIDRKVKQRILVSPPPVQETTQRQKIKSEVVVLDSKVSSPLSFFLELYKDSYLLGENLEFKIQVLGEKSGQEVREIEVEIVNHIRLFDQHMSNNMDTYKPKAKNTIEIPMDYEEGDMKVQASIEIPTWMSTSFDANYIECEYLVKATLKGPNIGTVQTYLPIRIDTNFVPQCSGDMECIQAPGSL